MRIWRMPLVVAMVSAAGLLSGVLADGAWDVVSRLGRAVPLAVIAGFAAPRA